MTFPEFNLAQAIGLIAYVCVLYSFSQKRDSRFISGQIVSSIFWVAHYFMMAKFAASAVTGVHVIRYGSAPFARANKKWSLIVAIIVALLYVCCGLLFANEFIDWMPIIASIIGSFAVALLHGIRMRIVFLVVSACWLSFNLLSHSIGGVLTDISVLTINAITILRLRRDQARELAFERTPLGPPA
ncbi:MAG TPA: YgjV family protein [Alphaproteobacteria bacterium]|nr:hypothetical protein [Rhodospirillaceae bacterium]HRJ11735.1 YgjV family protein [Alphaproteobacteria bacterium]